MAQRCLLTDQRTRYKVPRAMPRRRITISDWDEESPRRKPKLPSDPLTKLLLLAIIVFALYGMNECYSRYPPRIFHPQPQPQKH